MRKLKLIDTPFIAKPAVANQMQNENLRFFARKEEGYSGFSQGRRLSVCAKFLEDEDEED